jgi:uncharacterized membrane protein
MRSSLAAAGLLVVAACTPQAAPSASAAATAFPARLRALGTEPFWSIAIDGGTIVYTTPDKPKSKAVRVRREEAAGILKLSGRLAGEAISITITPESCSDGMSDIVYPYAAKVRLGGQALQGCARLPGAPEIEARAAPAHGASHNI